MQGLHSVIRVQILRVQGLSVVHRVQILRAQGANTPGIHSVIYVGIVALTIDYAAQVFHQ